MTLIDELEYRGFINQCTNEDDLIKLLNSEKLSFYIGFDCTAKSLHVGSLIQIMIMRIFQKYGHTPIILIGKGCWGPFRLVDLIEINQEIRHRALCDDVSEAP